MYAKIVLKIGGEKMNTRNVKDIVNQPYLDVEDLAILLMCSRSKAFKIKKEIKEYITSRNKTIFDSRYLPTKEVLDYLGNDYFSRLYNDNREE